VIRRIEMSSLIMVGSGKLELSVGDNARWVESTTITLKVPELSQVRQAVEASLGYELTGEEKCDALFAAQAVKLQPLLAKAREVADLLGEYNALAAQIFGQRVEAGVEQLASRDNLGEIG
jgi:hypothetical protein